MTGTLSLPEVNAWRRGQDRIVSGATGSILRLSRAWNLTDARRTEEQTRRALSAVLEHYGPMQREAALDLLNLASDAAGVDTRITVPSFSPDAETIASSAGWAVKPLFGLTDAQAFRQRLATVADTQMRAAVRSNIVDSRHSKRGIGAKVQLRYALLPAGKCCSFCSLLASRGAVYKDDMMARVHARCRCVLVPFYVDKDAGSDPVSIAEQMPGYAEQVQVHRDAYEKAKEQVGSHDFKAVLAEMRLQAKA